MRSATTRQRLAAVAMAVAALACQDAVSPNRPPPDALIGNSVTGSITVTTATTGADLDPNGYTVTVTGVGVNSSQPIATNGSATFPGLLPGNYNVQLTAVATNCTVSGANPRSATVMVLVTTPIDFAIGCTPTTGALRVNAPTTGADLDPDGYTVTVDGNQNQAIATGGTVTFPRLSPGGHQVALSGIATNCTVGGANPRAVSITAGVTATTNFNVSCTAIPTTGNLTVNAPTTGTDLDPDGYTVTVDGNQSEAIATGGTVTFPDLSAGSHQVALSGMATNCTVGGANPRAVNVTAGVTATTNFNVSCTATPTTGDLRVATATTGADLDPDGYTVALDPPSGPSQPAPIDGSVTFTDLPARNHTVRLNGLAANCTVTGANPVTVNISAGQTTETAFAIDCTAIPTTTGDLTVTTATTGADLDPDGYVVRVDPPNGPSQAIPIDGSVTFTDLPAGDRTVRLDGLAANCAVNGPNPRTVNVPAGSTTQADFVIDCTAISTTGNLTTNAPTTGADPDPDGYTVTVDGNQSQAVATNGSFTFTDLSAGSHEVFLDGVAGNCATAANPRMVDVAAGATATTNFNVSCTAIPTTGDLAVTTATTGADLDPDGYVVRVDPPSGPSQSIPINGSVTFTDLPGGSHTVRLNGATTNCTVSGANPRPINVPASGVAQVDFEITCAAPPPPETGNLRVTTTTSGMELDPDGYTVTIAGPDGIASRPFGVNETFTFADRAAGSHTVDLSGVAANCTVSGASSRTINVPAGGTAGTTFQVTCDPIDTSENFALRFFGNGTGDIDRVKIQIDDPTNDTPGPPADVGATDFTIEFWMRARDAENGAGEVACGNNQVWIMGNIIIDRDRHSQGRKFGISMAGGRIVFGVTGTWGNDLTICSTSRVDDDVWHHVAVTRARATGALQLFVDGVREAGTSSGPGGDVSYPDGGVPLDYCRTGPCTNSDPYLVIGAEKHDSDPQFYPSFSGWVDEVRLSTVIRYSATFSRPTTRFVPDANTAALYHFDEGLGNQILDSSGASGGPSNGVRRVGGNPAGPMWVRSEAPTGAP